MTEYDRGRADMLAEAVKVIQDRIEKHKKDADDCHATGHPDIATNCDRRRAECRYLAEALRALSTSPGEHVLVPVEGAFKIGERVEKVSGSSWRGKIVGTYSTELTPEGYAVESENEPGSVQIYPAKALRAMLSAKE